MPIRVCAEPGCPDPATYRGRCRGHARHRERSTPRSGYKIYRTKRWRMTRRRQLFKHPLCECGRIAVDVDHRIDIADGGDPWSEENLQSLCKTCHGHKTRDRQLRARERS